MSKRDREKRNLGGATQRRQPSFAAHHLTEAGAIHGRVLDFGCGFGYDAEHFGWESFDPFYGPFSVEGPFDTILCTQVLNAISGKHRQRAIAQIQGLLAPDGVAYLCVARNLPVQGKVCAMKRRQYYVVLAGADSVYTDKKREIYVLKGDSTVVDITAE